ncbi:exodeoxyribonuclease 7 large subunit [Candidatus Photodesmus katoptron]|uniref:Exodeoxyribonuclease 7 large subunit n=1 Tax=Candidatus Photodesmus katoptron Akat1 TaxID=1236703 RepID=S3DJN5_9GAMM|nr:exodeoxyribonuclease VII large subunit [Candidatus Photodesmus katoptron]EPE37349.1 exodeoxyribonuclease VII, large subunit [Candidatus Photodesmus katoptron Akat1]KEY89980.1 exodeoxyribonuclease 7 large subunit [Candidatus Photodesmus katoptron]
MLFSTNQNIFTVSRLNSEVKTLLENKIGFLCLVGEISNLSMPISGHWYFTLKDAHAQIKCAMFKNNNMRVNFKPKNGEAVIVKARLSVYEPRGDYQLIIQNMQIKGEGRLQQEFYELKIKLKNEGLFSSLCKKKIPKKLKNVGIITSKTGAALFDILKVLKRRDPNLSIIIYPTVVQGAHAVLKISEAILLANNRNECDVIIIARGGGSLEDLSSFNQERVARTIANSKIPIISAIGHETDVTITDLVSDIRASTPSVAAEMVSHDRKNQEKNLMNIYYKIVSTIQHHLFLQQKKITEYYHSLEKKHPNYQINKEYQRLDILESSLNYLIKNYISNCKQKNQRNKQELKLYSPKNLLEKLEKQLIYDEQKLIDITKKKLLNNQYQFSLILEALNAISPIATLKRGYSITQTKEGIILRSSCKIKTGDQLKTKLFDGEILSTVN